MIDIFNEYCDAGKIKQALIVGHNMVNQNPGNKEFFEGYFRYLISLVNKQEIENAKAFLGQATSSLAFFSENVVMDKEMVEFILEKEDELNNSSKSIYEKEENMKKEAIKKEVIYNNDALSLLEQLLNKMIKCTNENDFNECLNNLGKIDQSINRDRLSRAQEEKYVELTKKCSDIVSEKTTYFKSIENREYNMRAVEAYENVFKMFKNGQVIESHKDCIKSLFMFDMSRLYNETIVYYNHVYNYVLGKLSDEEKFLMTKYAIMCEKKR